MEAHQSIDNNTTFINHLFNIGIKSFGKEHTIAVINNFYNHYNLPIISIGSGIGAIEHFANLNYNSKYNKNIEWICVDNSDNPVQFPPSANKYISRPLTNIDYHTTDELIKDNPSIVSNCIIFLNWCEPNDSDYDYEAIIKLKPKAVLSIYEVFNDDYGAAGGKKFFKWTEDSDYVLREMYSLSSDHDMDIRIGWWQHSSILYDEDAVFISIESKIQHNNACCIM